jgi:HK97 family phage portal protein
LSTDNRRSIFSRVAHALRTFNAPEIAARSVIPTTLPGTGVAGLQMVRSANPQEYKPLGANVRARGFNEHPVVHACIRAVADIVASVPLVVLKEKGNRESAVGDNHPLQKLLNQPTGKMTARQLRARFAVDFLGYGNSMFHLERAGATGTGRIIGIRSINPEALQSVWVDTDGDPARYDYSDWSGIIRNAPVEDVLHFRDLDMPRPYFPDVFGYPRGATAIQSIVADNEATNYVRQVVSNDGTPTFAVILSDEATADDALSMQQRYTARTVERGKRGAPAFFGSVKDIKPLGFTLNDLEFPDLRRVSREDICAAFGVDPRMIGIGSASSDAGLSGIQYVEARARLVQHTIEPMLIVFEDEINNWLAPEFGDVYVAYDANVLRDLVENDEATSNRIRAEFAASLRTFEESRRALKLSPVPEPVESLLITPATTLMPSALAITPALSAEEEVALDAAPMPSANADAMVPPSGEMQTTEATVLNGAQIASAKDIVLAVAAGQMPRDAGVAMLKVFFNLSAEVAEALMGSAGTGAATTPNVVSTDGAVTPVASAPVAAPVVKEEEEEDDEEDDDEEEMEEESEVEGVGMRSEGAPVIQMTDAKRAKWERVQQTLDAEEMAYKAEAQTLFDFESVDVERIFAANQRADAKLNKVKGEIRSKYAKGGEYRTRWEKRYQRLIGPTYIKGAEDVGALGVSFTLQSKEVQRAIKTRANKLAGEVSKTSYRQISAAIMAGERAGLSFREIADLVQQTAFGRSNTDARAMAIARTEASGAMSQGSWDQAKDAGIFVAKEWLSFDDGNTRPTHLQARDEGVIPINNKFKSNNLEYPLDPSGNADEVINCRCTLVYYTQDEI